MLLSIIIPCYNEVNTIEKIIEKINDQDYIKKQIIIIDDNSNDGTTSIIKNSLEKHIDKVIYHKENQGKGAAIQSGLPFVKGDIVIIQDADLEYNPCDYKVILDAMLNMDKKVVYGSRVLNSPRYKNNNFTSLYRIFFNHVLTIITNVLYNQKLTDAHTCYKMIDSKIFKSLQLKEKGFAFCPELTTKLANLGVSIFEIPINYQGRTYEEGKKIGAIDGIGAIMALLKYKFFEK